MFWPFWLKAFQSLPPVREVSRFCGRYLSLGMECGGSSLPHSYSDEIDLLGLGVLWRTSSVARKTTLACFVAPRVPLTVGPVSLTAGDSSPGSSSPVPMPNPRKTNMVCSLLDHLAEVFAQLDAPDRSARSQLAQCKTTRLPKAPHLARSINGSSVSPSLRTAFLMPPSLSNRHVRLRRAPWTTEV